MRLTFHENKFVIRDLEPDYFSYFKNSRYWHRLGPNHYETRNIEAAVHFRRVADAKAESVFKVDVLRRYDVPMHGRLSPNDLELLKFQIERGIPHILSRNRSYIAHQPGLGKTAQFICANFAKPGLTTVIVPAFLKTNWAREITKWFRGDFPSIAQIPNLHQNGPVDFKALNAYAGVDFLIVSSAMLEKEWVRTTINRRKNRWIGIDEAHQFKTPGANRTVALFGGRTENLSSPGLIYNSEHVVFLSGTPLLNRPIELWPILRGAAPTTIDFMDYEEFGHRFCGPTRDERGRVHFLGSHNEDELKNRIQPHFMQRLLKSDVLPDLPKKIREVVVIDNDNRKADVVAYDKALLRKFDGDFERPEAQGECAKIRHLNGLAKVPWSAEFVDDILSSDTDEQIILYAHHRDVVQDLAHRLRKWNPRIIQGGVPFEYRTETEDLFNARKCRLVCANISAMYVGGNYPMATRVIFVEYAWGPSDNEQAEDRGNRLTSQWSILCQYIAIPGSIDEAMLTSNIIKETRIKKVVG